MFQLSLHSLRFPLVSVVVSLAHVQSRSAPADRASGRGRSHRTRENTGPQTWKACWGQPLRGSNPRFSPQVEQAQRRAPLHGCPASSVSVSVSVSHDARPEASKPSSYEEIARDRRGGKDYREGYAEAQRAFLLGQAVRERRLELGLSQVELAARAGMTQPALSRLEAGGVVPTIPVLDRISAALDADLIVTINPRAA